MKIAFAAVVVAAASAAASADIVNVRYQGTGVGSNVRITYNGKQSDVFAGQLIHEFSGATGASAYINGVRRTFCSDLGEYVTSTAKPYSIVPVSGIPALGVHAAEKAAAIGRLYTHAGQTAIATSAGSDWATAFQVTIWEIVNDYVPGGAAEGLALTTGKFTAKRTNNQPLTAGVTSLVNQFFSIATGTTESGAPIVGVTNAGAQDQIVLVPAPGAMALAGLGGLVMVKARRRRG